MEEIKRGNTVSENNQIINDNFAELYGAAVPSAVGTCATAAATAAKAVTLSDGTWILKAGSRISVKFTYTNTATSPTLNVNGTGAKSIWYNASAVASSDIKAAGVAGRYIHYVYDGTYYVFAGWSVDADSDTTYTNAALGQGYGTCATAEATVAKVVTLSGYALVTGGVIAVKFTYAVPASATLNVNSKGAKAIYYKGAAIAAGVINAGDTATFIYNGTYYHLLCVDETSGGTGGGVTFDDVYPVGSMYLSCSSTSPASLFGGTWTQIKGRFLLGIGANTANNSTLYGSCAASTVNRTTVGEQGGAATVTLTASQIPAHTHSVVAIASDGSSKTLTAGMSTGTWNGSNYMLNSPGYYPAASEPASLQASSTGGGGSHTNMPPYYAVYMWRRTA